MKIYEIKYWQDDRLDERIRKYGIRKICRELGKPQSYSDLSKALKGTRPINKEFFKEIFRKLTP